MTHCNALQHTATHCNMQVAGNALPFAVGVVLFDPATATVAEGRVLQVCHSQELVMSRV